MMKHIDVTLSDFVALRKSGLYVDKTDIIDEFAPLLQSSTSLIVNRPRRFGKSLMISMLETFYSQDIDSKPYFEDLKIAKSKNYGLINQFPVITLSFKYVATSDSEDMVDEIKSILTSIYDKWADRVLPLCDEREVTYYQRILSMKANESDYAHSIDRLGHLIERQCGKKPIVLVDEYDAPVESSFGTPYYEDVLRFLKGLYIATFKDANGFGFGFLSGVFGIAKGTLGTGLNNIPVDSGQTSPLSKNYFGFDEEEIDALSASFHLSPSEREGLRKYYGGYEFLRGYYYNPWSVLNYLSARDFASFWGNSGSNKSFSKVVGEAFEMDSDLLSSLAGDGIEASLDFTSSYESFGSDLPSALLYLSLAGYLCLHRVGFERYKVYLPNEETKECFINEIAKRYKDKTGLGKIAALRKAIETGDGEKLSDFFKSFLLSSLSYYDFSNEKNYQIMVGAIAALLFEDCIVKCEVIAGTGRCDIAISPLSEGGFGAVIEIKYVSSKISKARLQDRAKNALRQIKENDYLEELRQRKAKPLYAYGFAFYKNLIAVECERIED